MSYIQFPPKIYSHHQNYKYFNTKLSTTRIANVSIPNLPSIDCMHEDESNFCELSQQLISEAPSKTIRMVGTKPVENLKFSN
jgi:hypothetical protein